jgi:hypothetical protein
MVSYTYDKHKHLIAAVIVLFASGPIVATHQALAGFGFGGW